jgi:hypothetical protein
MVDDGFKKQMQNKGLVDGIHFIRLQCYTSQADEFYHVKHLLKYLFCNKTLANW